MLHQKKIVVVMPAYNASKTLEMTYREIPRDIVDEVILVDDASRDDTAIKATELGIHTIIHSENRGYGGNQRTVIARRCQRGRKWWECFIPTTSILPPRSPQWHP